MFDGDGQPADVHATRVKQVATEEPFVEPFVRDAGRRAPKFVPAVPGWAKIDAGLVLPTMFQQIVSGKKDVDGAPRTRRRRQMDEAFAK